MDLRDAGFAARARTALAAAGCGTLADVVAVAEKGGLLKMKGVGDRTARSILWTIHSRTGQDFFLVNGVMPF